MSIQLSQLSQFRHWKLALPLTILLFLVSLGAQAQQFNDQILLWQESSKYPQFRIQMNQGNLGYGHPSIEMRNYGGVTNASQPTPPGSWLGSLAFSGYDGASNVQIGRIMVQATDTFSPGHYPALMQFRVGGSGACCGAVRMVIDGETGNVGIGTDTPSSMLHVHGHARIDKVSVQSWWNGNVGHTNSSLVMNGDRINDEWQLFGDNARSSIGVITTDIFGTMKFITHHDADMDHGKTLTDEELVNENTRLVIRANGNIGIGTPSPDSKLTVAGHINVGGESNGWLKARHINGKHWQSAADHELLLNYHTGYAVKVGFGQKDANLLVSGNVGIGTTDPQAKLAVDGDILATKVKVVTDVNAVPDYVFDEDYDLTSLEEVQSYIQANKHLPEVPTATEMSEQGQDLGAMNLLLLKKIEELTLYQIDLMKEVKELRKGQERLQEENEQLKKAVNKSEP